MIERLSHVLFEFSHVIGHSGAEVNQKSIYSKSIFFSVYINKKIPIALDYEIFEDYCKQTETELYNNCKCTGSPPYYFYVIMSSLILFRIVYI